MEIIFTYLVPTEYVGLKHKHIDITRKVMQGSVLLSSSTMYSCYSGESTTFHQGHLADLYHKQQETINQLIKADGACTDEELSQWFNQFSFDNKQSHSTI